MTQQKIKVGMISFEHMHAHSYFNSLLAMPDVEIVGISEKETSRLPQEKIKELNIPVYAESEALLQNDLDAVIICSANVDHAPLTIEAIKAGAHVLCEKPLATTMEHMEQMIDISRTHDKKLMTAFPCRYIPSVVELKQYLDAKQIGELVAIKGTNRGKKPSGWFLQQERSGGGAIFDHTVHVADLMNWMLQSNAVEVYAEGGSFFQPESDIDDGGMLHIRYENGVFATLDPSWSRPQSFPIWGDVTMEVIGTGGVLTLDAFNDKNEFYAQNQAVGAWRSWGANMDASLLTSFIDSIHHDKPVPISGLDGMKSSAIALAAYESVRTGQPVQLKYDTDGKIKFA